MSIQKYNSMWILGFIVLALTWSSVIEARGGGRGFGGAHYGSFHGDRFHGGDFNRNVNVNRNFADGAAVRGHYYNNGVHYNYYHNGQYYNYYNNGNYYRYYSNGNYYNYINNGMYYGDCKIIPRHWSHGYWIAPTTICQ